jgi:hypothetical protein
VPLMSTNRVPLMSFAVVLSPLCLFAVVGFGLLFLAMAIPRITGPTRQLTARLERLEQAVTDRLDALEEQIHATPATVVSRSEDYEPLK